MDLESSISLANKAIVIAGAVLAVATALQIRWSDQLAKQKESALHRFQDESRATTAKLQLEAATQQERAALAERDLLAVKTRLKPRGINSSVFKNALSGTPAAAVIVEYLPGGPETFMFANNLRLQLHDCGWRVPEIMEAPTSALHQGSVLAEIVFVARSLEDQAPSIKGISAALRSVGLTSVGSSRDSKLPDSTLRIRIGPRIPE